MHNRSSRLKTIDLNKLIQARDHRDYGQPLFDFDEIVIASGVLPRKVSIAGIEKHTLKMDEAKEPSSLGEGPRIWSYADYLRNDPKIFGPVVIVGGGPIAIDVAEKILKEFSLLQKPSSSHEGRRAGALVGEIGQNLEPVSLIEGEAFNQEWGIDSTGQSGGWIFNRSRINDSPRDSADTQEGRIEVTLCQRSTDRIGQGLGKTSGWIHRDYLKRKGVRLLPGIQYIEVNSKGLLVEQSGQKIQLIAKEIILCAGQVESIQKPMKYITDKEESRELIHWDYWQKRMIGGALKADRIDAKRSIREGFEWAYQQD